MAHVCRPDQRRRQRRLTTTRAARPPWLARCGPGRRALPRRSSVGSSARWPAPARSGRPSPETGPPDPGGSRRGWRTSMSKRSTISVGTSFRSRRRPGSSPSTSVPEVVVLRDGGQLLERFATLFASAVPEGEEVPPVASRSVERDGPPSSSSLTRCGRETLSRSAACWVVSSAFTGTRVTALPAHVIRNKRNGHGRLRQRDGSRPSPESPNISNMESRHQSDLEEH